MKTRATTHTHAARNADPAPSSLAAPDVTVAYHAGPPEIGYAWRAWVRGAPQRVSGPEWTYMQMRADFHEFDFRVVDPTV